MPSVRIEKIFTKYYYSIDIPIVYFVKTIAGLLDVYMTV